MDGAAAEVHEAPDGLHHKGRDDVAGHSRQWMNAEDEHEHGSHQRTAAHAREADREPDEQSGECDGDVHDAINLAIMQAASVC